MNRRKSIGLNVRSRAVLKYGERDFLEKGAIVASWKVHLLIKIIEMHCFLEVLGVHEIQDLLNDVGNKVWRHQPVSFSKSIRI